MKRALKINNVGFFSLIFLIAFFAIAVQIPFYPDSIDGDEGGWMKIGKMELLIYWNEVILRQDLDNPIWFEDLGNHGTKNPNVAMYYLGFINLLAESTGIHFRLLLSAHSALCVMLLTYLVFINAKRKRRNKWVVAGAAFFLILNNPLFQMMKLWGYAEQPLFLFSLLALICIEKFEANREKNLFRSGWLIGFGIFAGMAVGSKLFGFSLFLGFIVYSTLHYYKSIKRWALVNAIVIACGLAVFILTNPTIMKDPFFGFYELSIGHTKKFGMEEEVSPVQLWDQVAPQFSYPFLLFSYHPIMEEISCRYTPFMQDEWLGIIFGYLFFLFGLVGIFKYRNNTMFIFPVSCLVFYIFLYVFILGSGVGPRWQFLSAMMMILIFAQGNWDGLIDKLRKISVKKS